MAISEEGLQVLEKIARGEYVYGRDIPDDARRALRKFIKAERADTKKQAKRDAALKAKQEAKRAEDVAYIEAQEKELAYRKRLMAAVHPDKGGDSETFRKAHAEFERQRAELAYRKRLLANSALQGEAP
jgi:hypothetical protein